jgi:hypothetical protein
MRRPDVSLVWPANQAAQEGSNLDRKQRMTDGLTSRPCPSRNSKPNGVLAQLKAKPRCGGLTAGLDPVCARHPQKLCGRDEKVPPAEQKGSPCPLTHAVLM